LKVVLDLATLGRCKTELTVLQLT